MNLHLSPKTLCDNLPSLRKASFLAAAAVFSVAGVASAQTVPQIGLKFGINGNGQLQSADPGALLPTDLAGAPAYAQTNWNTLGRWGDSSAAPFNVLDSTGANSGIVVNWDANNIWSQAGGGTPTVESDPNLKMMNAFDDSTGNANTTLANTVFGNPVANKPLVYISGIKAWLTAQSATYYDVVVYSDGDATAGRVGEYWLVDAVGPTSGLTYNGDLTTHTFICDRVNFVSTPTYLQVPATVAGGRVSQQGNFQGNFAVFSSLTNDSFLLRTEEFNSRSPINGVQIVPRVAALPAVIDPLLPAKVYAGGQATFRASAAGMVPMAFQWYSNSVALADGGRISGTATANLNITGVGAGDVANYYVVVSNAIGFATSSVAPLTLTTYVAGSYAEKIVTNFPTAYWRLNDTGDPSTNFSAAADYVGGFNGIYESAAFNGFDGIVGPQPTGYPGFESGNSAMQSANAAHSWVIAPPLNLNTNTVTITAWVYPTATEPGSAGLAMARCIGNDVSGLDYQNGQNLGYTWNNTNTSFNFTSGLIVPSNVWSFVAMVVTPTNAILYLLNTNNQSSATNVTPHFVAPFAGPTLIGDDASSSTTPQNRAFIGSIDEVAVFNRALPDTELYLLFKKGLGVGIIAATISTPPSSLTLYTGRNATFTVVAGGDKPLNYQWRTNGVNLVNGGRISGANSSTLVVSNIVASDTASYDVVVDNVAHTPIASSPAILTVVAPPSPLNGYESALQAANPTHYWRFNEAASSVYAYDYWGGSVATNDNAASGAAGPQPSTFPGFETTNAANSYDGLTSATETGIVGLMNNLSQFSIIGWFNTGGTIGQRVGLFGQNDVTEFGFHALGSDGLAQLGIFTANGGSAFLNQSLITPGQWYFTAAVGTGTNVSLYLFATNGSGGFVVSQATTVATTTNYGASAFPFNIGGDGILDTTGNYFTGLIDEVATFRRALSVGELANLFAVGIGVSGLAPQITTQPGSQTLYAGRNATFQVVAVGSSPLTYSWRTNGVALSDVGNVYGSSTANLTISNAAAINVGNYDVVITNGAGSITSSVATLGVITPASGGFEAATLALNPLSYWRLNETNGSLTAFDFWGGHNGTYQNAASNGVPGVPNPPFVGFEANNLAVETFIATSNSYVSVPPGSIGTNTVTFTAWLYPIGAQESWSGLLVTRGTAIGGGLNYNDQQMLGYTWNNNNQNTWGFASGLVIASNQWSFVAVTISPTNAILYLYDGVNLQTATNTVAHTPDVMGNNWQIGHDNNSGNNDGSRTFNGIIDEVALYLKTLTPAQIQQLYSSSGILVKLNIMQVGPNVVLTWPHGTLLEAPDVTGPWATNNATSPYTNAPSAARKFYKVIEQ